MVFRYAIALGLWLVILAPLSVIHAQSSEQDQVFEVWELDIENIFTGSEIQRLLDNNVNEVHFDRSGAIWIGFNRGNVINHYEPFTGQWSTFTIRDNLAQGSIEGIREDNSGYIWFGTVNGASRYNPKTKIWQMFTIDEHTDMRVYNISIDRSGRIWFGTNSGVSRYDLETKQWRTFRDDNPGENVDYRAISFHIDNSDVLWIGWWDHGVTRYDLVNEKWQTFTTEDGLAGNQVVSILQDSSGLFWFGTDHGINQYDPGP